MGLDNSFAVGSMCDEPQTYGLPRRLRRDWVRGDVHCLMCARLIGHLLGSLDSRPGRRRISLDRRSFFAYRSAEADAPVVAYSPGMGLRCCNCGGAGTLDDIELFSTYDEQPGAFDHDDILRRRRGRPPRHGKTPQRRCRVPAAQ
jgi:hypothetical protein